MAWFASSFKCRNCFLEFELTDVGVLDKCVRNRFETSRKFYGVLKTSPRHRLENVGERQNGRTVSMTKFLREFLRTTWPVVLDAIDQVARIQENEGLHSNIADPPNVPATRRRGASMRMIADGAQALQ